MARIMGIERDGVQIFLTADELLIINNALNEVCNVLEMSEFSTMIGASREEALALLGQIAAAFDGVTRKTET